MPFRANIYKDAHGKGRGASSLRRRRNSLQIENSRRVVEDKEEILQ
jgi:hypothetical protein